MVIIYYVTFVEKTRLEAKEAESRNSNRRSGCNIKNGECVPKCSELTIEELNSGLQCEVGKKRYRLEFFFYFPLIFSNYFVRKITLEQKHSKYFQVALVTPQDLVK